MFPRLSELLTLRHRRLRDRNVLGAHTNDMAEGGLPLGSATWKERNLFRLSPIGLFALRRDLDGTGD